MFGFCDQVTVLRRGKFAGAGHVKDLSADDMAAMMMGGQRDAKIVPKTVQARGAAALELKRVCANKESGVPAINGVNLSVH